MFERFTKKSRRAVFFARYAALKEGAAQVEPNHLLIGLEREDKETTDRFMAEHPELERLRKIEPAPGLTQIRRM